MSAEQELDFLEDHFNDLMNRYSGEWIMIVGEEVMWHGNKLAEGHDAARLVVATGRVPFIHYMHRLEEHPTLINPQPLLEWIDERVKYAVQARDLAIEQDLKSNVAYYQGLATGLAEIRKQIEKRENS